MSLLLRSWSTSWLPIDTIGGPLTCQPELKSLHYKVTHLLSSLIIGLRIADGIRVYTGMPISRSSIHS